MPRHRVTPHKPQRDTATRDVAEVKRDNHKLRRQIARLQKTVARLLEQQTVPENETEADQKPLSGDGMQCPACAEPLSTITVPTGMLRVCKDCGWRKKS